MVDRPLLRCSPPLYSTAGPCGSTSFGMVAHFAATLPCRVLFRGWRCSLTSGWIAHQPVEVRSWPQYDVILRHELAMVALAYVLPEPVVDLTRLHAHCCLRSPWWVLLRDPLGGDWIASRISLLDRFIDQLLLALVQ